MNDQQRIETAADNCEVLRARLARYEDSQGVPLSSGGGLALALMAALESVVHDERVPNEVSQEVAAVLIEAQCLNSSPVSAGEYGDAYQGAREDLAIWKRRALEAESKIREQDQIIDNLGNALNDENGPTFMGEPVIRAGGVDERAAFEAWYETTYGISLEPEFRANHFIGYVNDKANHRWTAWQARAALSAPSHGEQVREVVNQCAETCERAKLCSTCAGGLEFPGLPDPGSIAEARIPHHTSDGRQMLWTEVEVIAHKIIQGAIYSWVKDPGNDGGFYAPMMLSFRAAAPSAGSQQGGNV